MNNLKNIENTQYAIERLAGELKKNNLWTESLPTAEQLCSKEPFCVDTMAFEQWLQWVFIPQMRTLLTENYFNALPHKSDMHSMAEYVFKNYAHNTDAVLDVIKKIDDALNSFGQQSMH